MVASMLVRLEFKDGRHHISKSHCRGYLLRTVRAVLTRSLSMVVGYKLVVERGKRPAPPLGTINRIVRHVCPHLPSPIIGTENCIGDSSWKGREPFVSFDIDPEFLQYGWAMNGLLVGYLRQYAWKLQTGAHRADIVDLRLRLKHWWENDWATNPSVTWYFGERFNDQRAALGTIFSYRKGYGNTLSPILALTTGHEVTKFGYRMIELGLSKDGFR